MTIVGNYAYLTDDWRGLRIINISDPLNPWEVGFYEFGGEAYKVAVSGGYAYVVEWDKGLRIIDVSNPESPSEMSFIEIYRIRDVAISGNVVIVVTGLAELEELKAIDVSNPSNPAEIDEYSLFTPYSITVHENYIYVADREAGLLIFEFRLPGP